MASHDLENLLDNDHLFKQIYEECIEASKNGFLKWCQKASKTYTKDELQVKFNELCRILEFFNTAADNLNKALAEKPTNLINDTIETSNKLGITLPDVDFTGSYAILVDLLEKTLEMLKAFEKNSTLKLSTIEFELKSPTTHKRITQSYEEFKAILSARKNQRSTGLFWKEHGIPEIVVDAIDNSEASSLEDNYSSTCIL